MCRRLPESSRTEAVISRSVIESRAEVASSKMRRRGWRRSARAIEIRWRSPPETRRPALAEARVEPLARALEERAGRGLPERLEHLLVGRVRLHELEVLADRPGEELRVLGDEADLAPHAVVAQLVRRDVVDRDDAAGRGVEPDEELHETRLAGARGTDEGDRVAQLRAEADVVERVLRRSPVAEGDVLEAEAPDLADVDGILRSLLDRRRHQLPERQQARLPPRGGSGGRSRAAGAGRRSC